MELTEEQLKIIIRNHESQCKAKRDYYNRNKAKISEQRKEKYKSKKLNLTPVTTSNEILPE